MTDDHVPPKCMFPEPERGLLMMRLIDAVVTKLSKIFGEGRPVGR